MELVCFYCNKQFFGKKEKKSKRRFCSTECFNKQQQIDQSDNLSQFRYFVNQARSSSYRKGLEFNIEPEELEKIWQSQNGLCNLSGEPLYIGNTSFERHTSKRNASLDRIDSKLGYIHDNVQFIHKDLQPVKSNLPENIFISWCRKISWHTKDRLILNACIDVEEKPLDNLVEAWYNESKSSDPPF